MQFQFWRYGREGKHDQEREKRKRVRAKNRRVLPLIFMGHGGASIHGGETKNRCPSELSAHVFPPVDLGSDPSGMSWL